MPPNEQAVALLRQLPHLTSMTFATSVPLSLLSALGSTAQSASMQLKPAGSP